jgi:hypothetical protein
MKVSSRQQEEALKVIACATISTIFAGSLLAAPAMADCSKLPSFAKVQTALKESTKPSGGESNGGLDLNMWASVVDRDVLGIECNLGTELQLSAADCGLSGGLNRN